MENDRIVPQTEKAGYTTGPWEIAQYEDRKGFSISAEAAGCIAERWYASEHEDVPILANARLIAAAPELLEALKGMIELERHTRRLPDTINRDWMDGIINDAKAAIRKAEGQS